jgi:chromosome segregation ATPase
VSADTEALLGTVRAELLERQAVIADAPVYVRRDQEQINAAHDALDSLAAELERLRSRIQDEHGDLVAAEAELERVTRNADDRVKASDYLREQMQAELERVKAESESRRVRAEHQRDRVDKALSALRWIEEFASMMQEHTGFVHVERRARAAIAEIEGDPEWKPQEC